MARPGSSFLLGASAAVVLAAAPARATQLPAAGLAIAIDGERDRDRILAGPGRGLWEFASETLAGHGFVVLSSADPDRLVGGDLLADGGIAWLDIHTHQPAFSFNVVLLSAHWTRTRAGLVRLLHPRSGAELWHKEIKVKVAVPEGGRRDAAIAEIKKLLAELRPKPGLPARSQPFLAGLLTLNDARLGTERFLERAQAFLRAENVPNPPLLVDLAAEPRTASDPELRAELLRRAVVAAGPAIEPALARALIRDHRDHPGGSPLTELLIEACHLIGASPGDALWPALLSAPLDTLLAARRRYTFRDRRDALDERLEKLALAEVRAAPDFDAAEQAVARLPIERFGPAARAALRDELFARVTLDAAEEQIARFTRHFPGRDDLGQDLTHLDQAWLKDAASLLQAPEHVRMQHYREYLRCVPRGTAGDPLARALALEAPLEAELRRRLAASPGPGRELEALRAVYGARPGPAARAALARALVAALGPAPRPEEVAKLLQRHPDVDELAGEARRVGAVRDGRQHVFEVAIGAGEAAVTAAFPQALARREVSRRDLSPAAFVAADERVPKAAGSGIGVLEVAKRFRVLLDRGRVFRIVINDFGGRFHHGLRKGDLKSDATAQLGPPSASRALLFGREVLSWDGLDGGGSTLSAVFDHGRIAFLYEEDARTAREALASLR